MRLGLFDEAGGKLFEYGECGGVVTLFEAVPRWFDDCNHLPVPTLLSFKSDHRIDSPVADGCDLAYQIPSRRRIIQSFHFSKFRAIAGGYS
jgi:hypothetical protein